MRDARLVSSRSRVRFSIVSAPGRVTLLFLLPFALARAGKESGSRGVYCLAKLDKMLATAADVSCDMMGGGRDCGRCGGGSVARMLLRHGLWFLC